MARSNPPIFELSDFEKRVISSLFPEQESNMGLGIQEFFDGIKDFYAEKTIPFLNELIKNKYGITDFATRLFSIFDPDNGLNNAKSYVQTEKDFIESYFNSIAPIINLGNLVVKVIDAVANAVPMEQRLPQMVLLGEAVRNDGPNWTIPDFKLGSPCIIRIKGNDYFKAENNFIVSAYAYESLSYSPSKFKAPEYDQGAGWIKLELNDSAKVGDTALIHFVASSISGEPLNTDISIHIV
ncbi:hypothetical protein F7430_22390 [Salmonella enterica]|nr:hypothetical protein [Salmonella enterica]